MNATTTPRIVVETITPERAHELLGGNTHNRNIRERRVATLARDMAAGRWQMTGDTIKVAGDGTILDGQHRLFAVVESETAVTMVVAYDVDKTTQMVMDTGAARTFADSLKLRGETHPNDKAACARKWSLLEMGLLRTTSRFDASRQELMDFFLERRDEIHEAVLMAGRYANRMNAPKSAFSVAAAVLNRIDSEDAEYFFQRAADGQGLVQGDAIYALRRALANRDPVNSGTNNYYIIGLIFKAWNAYRSGTPIHTLMFRMGGRSPETMPEPK